MDISLAINYNENKSKLFIFLKNVEYHIPLVARCLHTTEFSEFKSGEFDKEFSKLFFSSYLLPIDARK